MAFVRVVRDPLVYFYIILSRNLSYPFFGFITSFNFNKQITVKQTDELFKKKYVLEL